MHIKKQVILKKIMLLFLVLYAFLVSINLMSASFGLFGMDFANGLFEVTSNPFVGLFIGILATSIIQSSSSTTAIVVGLVAGGVLNLSSAIPIIMGANVGTSVTNMLVSLAHSSEMAEFRKAFSAAVVHDFFNLLTLIVLFPLEITFHIIERSAVFISGFLVGTTATVFSSPMTFFISPVVDFLTVAIFRQVPAFMFITSLAVLFISLNAFVRLAKPLAKSEFKHVLHNSLFKTPGTAFIFGICITAFVQSSSVTTSLVVPLVGVGLLTVRKIYPYVLGANLGTTVTAILAALAIGHPVALTVALSHLVYNIFGIVLFYPLRRIPIRLALWFSRAVVHSRKHAITYIIFAFYVVPAAVIFIF
ncbi:MAG: Na/Pi symporter [archaeon]|nr:Na/Pi symporter [archaeon]